MSLMPRFLGRVSGKKPKNIRNIDVEVLIFNPYISVAVSVDLSHTAAAEIQVYEVDDGLRTVDSDEHNYCSHNSTWYSADGRVTHAWCCLLTLMGGSVVTSCSLLVLLSTCGVCPGLCARERATKTDKSNFW